jgi:phage terminase small subunit
MSLTNKQTQFVTEYLRDFNATQAAIRVGYSRKSARVQGSRLLTNADISAAIKEKIMGADEVLARTTDIAQSDIADLMDITPNGFIIKLMDADADGNVRVNPKTKLIKKIKQKVTTYLAKSESGEDREIVETEIELYNAQEALVTLGKHHKLFTDKVEVNNTGDQRIIVEYVNPITVTDTPQESDTDPTG